jgi:4-hydroxybenzoate polyprenyltransferase
LAYLQLLRLPNVFTAWADVSMGSLLASGGAVEARFFLPILLSSSCLYLAGMVLNDVCDYQQDCRERPMRPLPSGRIRQSEATSLGIVLLLIGVAAAWFASWILGGNATGLIAVGLAACVLGYDLAAKGTILGPPLMGTCRFLNVLLGTSVAGQLIPPHPGLIIAAGIGIYVAGITWFARAEARDSQRAALLRAALVMAIGVGLLIWGPLYPGTGPTALRRLTRPGIWPALLVLLTVPVGRHVVAAIFEPSPHRVQRAVQQAIMTLILLDAAVCLATVGAPAAVAVLSLLIPFTILARWVYST